MKFRFSFSILFCAISALLLLEGKSFAQQKSEEQAAAKKTINIHVTTEIDGNVAVIDTTIVTEDNFDTDVLLQEKGVTNDRHEAGRKVEKCVIIRHPGSQDFSRNKPEINSPDTIVIENDNRFIYKDNHDLLAPSIEAVPFDYRHDMPHDFNHMEKQQFEMMLEGLARSFGLENVWPFGEMEKVVIKKKRNGKKVIITFEDREENNDNANQGNKKEEQVIILKNEEQGMSPENEEQIIIDGKTGENVLIRRKVVKTENGEQVITNAEIKNPSPVKKEKKVIIITKGSKK